jgi:hypothetical protein
MANRPRDGYPAPWGSQLASVFPVNGPSSYTQYTAPTTGGQSVTLQGPSGVKIADFVVGAVTTDGLHRAEVVQYIAGTVSGRSLARAAVILKWYVVAGGAEVAGGVNLSAKVVNLLVIGPK